MADPFDWDDLRVLLAVLETRSLSKAATRLGLTQPTVGRRLDALEAAAGGLLVERGPRGCVATALAVSMQPALQSMQAAAEAAEQVRASASRRLAGSVKVACGEAVGRRIAAASSQILADAPELELEVVTGLGLVNLERGDADLAVRNRAPKQDNLRARRLGVTGFAVYAAPGLLQARPELADPASWRAAPWIGFDAAHARVASQRWLTETVGATPRLRLQGTSVVVEAVAAGAGLAVLGTIVGDVDPRLVRVGAPIEALAGEAYLVSHARTRRVPRVRYVADALVRLLGPAG